MTPPPWMQGKVNGLIDMISRGQVQSRESLVGELLALLVAPDPAPDPTPGPAADLSDDRDADRRAGASAGASTGASASSHIWNRNVRNMMPEPARPKSGHAGLAIIFRTFGIQMC